MTNFFRLPIDGQWDNGQQWSTTSGGPPAGAYPIGGDTAIFDANSAPPSGELAIRVNKSTAIAGLFMDHFGASLQLLNKIALTAISTSTESPVVGTQITTTLTPSGATVTYQWYRGSTAIQDATGSSYTPVTDDIGQLLKVAATGTGNYTDTVGHTLTNVVAPATLELVSITASTDKPIVGTEITTDLLPSGATATYQWYYGSSIGTQNSLISGAVSSSYTPSSARLGQYLRVAATGTGNYTGTVSKVIEWYVQNGIPGPENLTWYRRDGNNMYFRWNDVPGAVSYSVQYQTNLSVTWQNASNGTTYSTNYQGAFSTATYYTLRERPAIFPCNSGRQSVHFGWVFRLGLFVQPEQAIVEQNPQSDSRLCPAVAATGKSGQATMRFHLAKATLDARRTAAVKRFGLRFAHTRP